MERPSQKVVFTACLACAIALIVCTALVTYKNEDSDSPVSLMENIVGGHDDIVDPALLRLTNDEWFTTTADQTLEEAAVQVARKRLEHIIIARVHRMTHGYPADIEKVTRVAEEQIIYDKRITDRLEQEVALAISPGHPDYELPVVRALEEKLKAKIMHTLTKEAIREINLLVEATGETPTVKQMTKDHLIEKTTDMLVPQVEGRVRRFVLSRVRRNAHAGVEDVLKYLAHSVDEEEKRELLGGPLVPNVDYSFREANGAKEEVETGPTAISSAAAVMKVAKKSKLAPKTVLGDVSPTAAPSLTVTPPAPSSASTLSCSVLFTLACALIALIAL